MKNLSTFPHLAWAYPVFTYQEAHQRLQKEGGKKYGNFFPLVLGEPHVTERKKNPSVTQPAIIVIIKRNVFV